MSGATIPYHLRPHKAVDRRLFVDLLNRFERWKPLTDYVYASMGSYPLEDHKAIHRNLGVSRLMAFDYEEDVVQRQLFNRPVDRCVCLHKSAGQFIEELESHLGRDEFKNFTGVIIWLDYTNPKDIGKQIREFQALISRLGSGDLVRVTVNSHARNYLEDSDASIGGILREELARKHFSFLEKRIGDFFPSGANFKDTYQDTLPALLAASFANAAQAILPASGSECFLPLSIIRYADGLQMLSITGAICARSEAPECFDSMALSNWPFFSKTWGEVHKLVVPALTLRERLFLERGILDKDDSTLINELGFNAAAGTSLIEFLDNFRKYYRFYPTLLAADI